MGLAGGRALALRSRTVILSFFLVPRLPNPALVPGATLPLLAASPYLQAWVSVKGLLGMGGGKGPAQNRSVSHGW